jgi:hypothetical protein
MSLGQSPTAELIYSQSVDRGRRLPLNTRGAGQKASLPALWPSSPGVGSGKPDTPCGDSSIPALGAGRAK